jgi:hypothetical protein
LHLELTLGAQAGSQRVLVDVLAISRPMAL